MSEPKSNDLGVLVWKEDDDLFGDPTTIHTKWLELFQEAFDIRKARQTAIRGDYKVYWMPNGFIVVSAHDGWHIYEPEDD